MLQNEETGSFIEKVSEQTSRDRLVTNDKDTLVMLELDNYGLQTGHQILIRLDAAMISAISSRTLIISI